MRSVLLVFLLHCTAHVQADEKLWSQVLDLANPPATYLINKEKLESTALLRGSFTQRRTIKVLKNPLVSSGKFVYSKADGLLWQLLTPFESNYIISQAVTRQLDNNTRGTSSAPDRVVQGISKILSAMFSGDFKHLERYFDLYYQGDEKAWAIGLVANKSVIKKLIDKIVLRGETNIQSIMISESGGDIVEITFANLSSKPPILTKQELDRFSYE